MVPNMVLSPKLSSIRKKRVDQKGLAGKRAITSVKAMKARPVPSTPYMCGKSGRRQLDGIKRLSGSKTLTVAALERPRRWCASTLSCHRF